MKVTCLMPTFNRYPHLSYLVEEAVECFLRQDHNPKELIICNDTPGQVLKFDHPQIKIYNLDERMPTLSDKIQFMIDQAEGDAFCRWDDDDIHLPWRLSTSVKYLRDDIEWRASNHFYAERDVILKETVNPGNSHVHSIWTRECLEAIGGYPSGLSGCEDQTFNTLLREKLGPYYTGQRLSIFDVYYIYRWGTGSHHLSGKSDHENSPENPHQSHWDELGKKHIQEGLFPINVGWRHDWVAKHREFALKQTL